MGHPANLTALAVAALAGALAGPVAFDVDVAVPPGSPVDWGRSFPAITPGEGSLFARTPPPPEPTAEQRTKVREESPRLDVRFSSSFDLTRILTHDIVVELGWIETRPAELPISGRSSLLPARPQPGDPLYWVTLTPLLRLLLHPSTAPRNEVETHLIEIGTPVLSVLESAQGQAYLRRTCNRIREAVEPTRDRAPSPRTGGTEVEAMLRRFVFDELRREHPYDPVGAFGERLFLFGDELQPYVAEYAADGNAFLRRSAVAALGRYRTKSAVQALLSIASTTSDQVALTRACAALGRGHVLVEPAALIGRLERATDTVERTALISALGRIGSAQVAPPILAVGEGALKREDSDLLVTVLTALARIRPGEHAGAVRELALAVERALDVRPYELGPRGGLSPVKADRPDSREQRPRVLRQLSLVVQAALDPFEPELQRRVLELLSAEELGDPLHPSGQWLNSVSLSRVEAPVRHVYVDLLERMDVAGYAPLASAVDDPGNDAALRGYALARLAWGERRGRVEDLLRDGADAHLRIHALGLADRDDHPQLDELARLELERCADLEAGFGSPEQRFLCLGALRALGNRGRLTAADVLPLLHHAESPREAFGDFPDELRTRVEELVAKASVSKSNNRRNLELLLEDVLEVGIHPALAEEPREALLTELTGMLTSARAHKRDVVFLELAVAQILERLLGYPQPRWSRELAQFSPQVQLEEEILLALGRTGAPEAVAALQRFVLNRSNRLRPVACLALGLTGDAAAANHLAPFLVDEDPFTRWCAYRSIAHLAGVAMPIDWMYGEREGRFAAAQEVWRELLEAR